MSIVKYKSRKNTDSTKWDGYHGKFGSEDLLPLWIADMDFEVPECVKDGLKEYIDEGAFGYYTPPKAFFDTFLNWEMKYHNYQISADWIRFAPGVVPALNWLIQALTKENENIIIMSPVYYPFREAIENNKRGLIESHLNIENDRYVIDFADFENKIVEHDVKMFIFCSPHNPVGRVWSREEIIKVMDICQKHNVLVISDEIHQDLIMSGFKQTTTATTGNYDDFLITLTAASKTFNLAACQNSFLIIPDLKLRQLFDDYTNRIKVTSGNAFGYIAVMNAYKSGLPWLEEVLKIVENNYTIMKKLLQDSFPEIWISQLQGTYLMWIDLGAYIKSQDMIAFIQEKCRLAVDYGSWFGGEKYATFIRVNLATSNENIRQAAEALVLGLRDKEDTK